MGKIKNSTKYILIIILFNYFIGIIIMAEKSITIQYFIINIITLVCISIIEILLTNILININNNSILQTELLEKIYHQNKEKQLNEQNNKNIEQTIGKQVNIIE